MIIKSNCENDTYELGKSFGLKAVKGDIICLDGDLGAGKTVFTKGFAAGLGIDDMITSPTFTIVCEYHSGRCPLYHFDVYRIEASDEMFEIGFDEYLFGDGICLIEWASNIEDIIPKGATHIRISRDDSSSGNCRIIEIQED